MPARDGYIMNVPSSLICRSHMELAVYMASKTAVDALTHAFTAELGP